MQKILLITSQFPYEGGEQFLETEVKYYQNIDLTIMPKSSSSLKRRLLSGIKIDTFLIDHHLQKSKLYYLTKSLLDSVFYKEFFSEYFFSFGKIKMFLTAMYAYKMYYEMFDEYFSTVDDLGEMIIYTYWHDIAGYALQSLKGKYGYKLISRTHGGDLYRERKQYEYMPLKKHFVENIDKIYTITQSANEYLYETYGFDPMILSLSRLGVEDRNIKCNISSKNSMNIVSCSFMTEVKQVDKIIRSLKIVAEKIPKIQFLWTHIGDGELYDDLFSLAKNELDDIVNISYSFVGKYDNEKVYDFYKENAVDVFINVSSAEGVPVSIMEAMSCHIPIIAPDVGGISDMVVDGKNGILLPDDFKIINIVNALKVISFWKDDRVRDSAYAVFIEKYNAKKNYPEFLQDILKCGI